MRDPYWTTAKDIWYELPSVVCHCGTPILTGDRVMYFPGKPPTAECEDCGSLTQGMLDDERNNDSLHAM